MRAGWRVNAPNYSQLASPQLKVAVPFKGCCVPACPRLSSMPSFFHFFIQDAVLHSFTPPSGYACPPAHSPTPQSLVHRCILLLPVSLTRFTNACCPAWCRALGGVQGAQRGLASGIYSLAGEESHRYNPPQARGKGLVPCDRAWSIRKAGRAPRSRHLAALGWRSEGSLIVH